jgi:putative membrane protein
VHGFFVRTLITALGLWIAAAIVPPMEFTSGLTLLGAALLLGIVNAIVRPVFIFLTLPITILSLGIFLLVINAVMLGLVAAMLDGVVLGGFFSAVLASIIVSLTSWFASSFIGPKGRIEIIYTRRRQD